MQMFKVGRNAARRPVRLLPLAIGALMVLAVEAVPADLVWRLLAENPRPIEGIRGSNL